MLRHALSFAAQRAQDLECPCPSFSPDATKALLAHPFPGNVRELEARIARAFAFCEGAVITAADLDLAGAGDAPSVRPRSAPPQAPTAVPTTAPAAEALARFFSGFVDDVLRLLPPEGGQLRASDCTRMWKERYPGWGSSQGGWRAARKSRDCWRWLASLPEAELQPLAKLLAVPQRLRAREEIVRQANSEPFRRLLDRLIAQERWRQGVPSGSVHPASGEEPTAPILPGEIRDVSLAICGHAWHGKSTLLGKLLAETGLVTPAELEQAQRQARDGRDPSLVFAQLVFREKDPHAHRTEAARGVSVRPSIVRLQYERHRVSVIDTPGQEAYTNNRFCGMFQAEGALLVVDCWEGPMPMTHEVLRILRGFEIPLRGVVLSKMDRVGYREQAYLQREDEVRLLVEEHEVPHGEVMFIPVSAYDPARRIDDPGEGLTRFSSRMSWYDGPTVAEFMGELERHHQASRFASSPLRLVFQGSETHDRVTGVGAAFRAVVETGTVRPESLLRFEPTSAELGRPVTAKVRSVQLTRGQWATPGLPLEVGAPRQLVGISIKNLSVNDTLRGLFRGRGIVAGSTGNPPTVARVLDLELTVIDPETLLRIGEELTMHAHVDRVSVRIEAIESARLGDGFDSEWLAPGEWGRVRVSTVNRPVAIEPAGFLPPLSKVILRTQSKAVAYGRCLRVHA
ncbi:MAG: GTP-binding protein [Planctomycetota bacterium]